MKITQGNYITVEEYNPYFSNVTAMLLEHFDREELKDTSIIMGSYCREPISVIKLRHPNKRIIVYQLEQLVDGTTWWPTHQSIKNMQGADEIWEYDFLNQYYLDAYYKISSKLVPLRYTTALDRKWNDQEDIDVLFYGFINQRRARIIERLQIQLYPLGVGHVKVVFLFGFQDGLDDYIKRSKIILNIHAFEPYHRQEVVRMFYPIINGKCVLSETSQWNNLEGMIVESDPLNLASKIDGLLKDDNYKTFGMQARERFKEIKNLW